MDVPVLSPVSARIYGLKRRLLDQNFVPGPQRHKFVHFSFHKCLTSVYQRIMRAALASVEPHAYRHFKSGRAEFEAGLGDLVGASLNNHAIKLSDLPWPVRATCFIRDPRDLVVSGYFYHRKGTERWTRSKNPTDADWRLVNGKVPDCIPLGSSFKEHLASVDTEAGLLAELEFRRYHLETMRQWDFSQPGLRLFRYEDFLFREQELFGELADHYEFPAEWSAALLRNAEKLSLKKNMGKSRHIRDPKGGQWRKVFTDRVNDAFMRDYADLVTKLGYEAA